MLLNLFGDNYKVKIINNKFYSNQFEVINCNDWLQQTRLLTFSIEKNEKSRNCEAYPIPIS